MFLYTRGLSYHHKLGLEEKGNTNKEKKDILIYINTTIKLIFRVTKSFLHTVFLMVGA